MKILQINSTVNTGSTGRISEEIGQIILKNNNQSYIAFGRGNGLSTSKLIHIGGKSSVLSHGIKSLVFDRHGFGSRQATKELVKQIEKLKPDVIGLHNLHGYYINVKILFSAIQHLNIPVLWTLFDCWAFTGHCAYYDDIQCEKWKTECHHCPKTAKYPKSIILDQSSKNYNEKKRLFHLPENLELVVHSKWLELQVGQSFLRDLPIHHVYNGTDLGVFKPSVITSDKLILGVASTWDARKGLLDFIKLRELLPSSYCIRLIGLSKRQIKSLPKGIEGITRTEDINELANHYSNAQVFVNLTYMDNFPTTNVEALACGTPVITYNTGGSPEAVDENTGFVIEKGDINGIVKAIKTLDKNGKAYYSSACRKRAEEKFDMNDRYQDYIDLYKKILLK